MNKLNQLKNGEISLRKSFLVFFVLPHFLSYFVLPFVTAFVKVTFKLPHLTATLVFIATMLLLLIYEIYIAKLLFHRSGECATRIKKILFRIALALIVFSTILNIYHQCIVYAGLKILDARITNTAPAVSKTAPFAQNIPTGFRKIKWGDTPEQHKKHLRKLTNEERKRFSNANYDAYIWIGEKLSIGSAELDRIIYYFTKETGLLRVDLLYHKDEERALNRYFEARWGSNPALTYSGNQDKTSGFAVARWYSDDVTASIYRYGVLEMNRRLSLVSISRTKEYAELWKMKKTSVQERRKQNFQKAVDEDF